MALFWTGCGGDANPLPRSKIELCQKYGRELAGAVEDVLGRQNDAGQGDRRRDATDDRPAFDSAPDKEQWPPTC